MPFWEVWAFAAVEDGLVVARRWSVGVLMSRCIGLEPSWEVENKSVVSLPVAAHAGQQGREGHMHSSFLVKQWPLSAGPTEEHPQSETSQERCNVAAAL